jgi:protease IV
VIRKPLAPKEFLMDTEIPTAEMAPSPPTNSNPASAPWPPQIVVQCGSGRLQRFFGWAGWFGFGASLLVLLSWSFAMQQYFDTTGGIQERYHSGEKHATDKVAIISVTGTIIDGSGFVKNQIDRIRDDKNVKAIVVRVVSPGGTITGSDYILHHLAKLRDEKKIPLVVSMGSIAASGGYYVAMAVGDQEQSIYAEPTTTTGSIGVIIPHYDLTGLLERFDIEDTSLASHPNKQMLSMTRSMTDEQRKIVEAYLDAAFVRFKERIKLGRPVFRKDPAALDQLATGEIFTADQAKQFGLIDEIGFVEDAIDRVIALANLKKDKTRVVQYERTASLLNLPWLVESQHARTRLDLAQWFDLHAPQAYYLATTLPALVTQAAR